MDYLNVNSVKIFLLITRILILFLLDSKFNLLVPPLLLVTILINSVEVLECIRLRALMSCDSLEAKLSFFEFAVEFDLVFD